MLPSSHTQSFFLIAAFTLGGSNTHTSILLGSDIHTCLYHHKYEQWHPHTGPGWVWVRVSLGCPSGAELMVPVPSDPDWLHWATFCYADRRSHLLTILDLIQPLNYISLRCVRWRPPVFICFSDFCQIWGSVPMTTSPLGFLFYWLHILCSFLITLLPFSCWFTRLPCYWSGCFSQS